MGLAFPLDEFGMNPAQFLYLVLGVLTLVIICVAHLWQHRHDLPQGQILTWLMEEQHPERKRLWYRIRAWVIAPVLVVLSVVFFWPVVWWMKCAELLNDRRAAQEREEAVFKVKAQHLLERLTAEEIESREMVYDPLNAVPNLPFGHLNEVWAQLKAAKQTKDELWSFAATWLGDDDTPELRKGYVLWRRRKPLGHILKMSNKMDFVSAKSPPTLGSCAPTPGPRVQAPNSAPTSSAAGSRRGDMATHSDPTRRRQP